MPLQKEAEIASLKQQLDATRKDLFDLQQVMEAKDERMQTATRAWLVFQFAFEGSIAQKQNEIETKDRKVLELEQSLRTFDETKAMEIATLNSTIKQIQKQRRKPKCSKYVRRNGKFGKRPKRSRMNYHIHMVTKRVNSMIAGEKQKHAQRLLCVLAKMFCLYRFILILN